MSIYADLPEEVSARVVTRVQVHAVATGALRGILLYEAPQIASTAYPSFGSEFHRARVPWLAAYVADRHGRLRYATRSDMVEVRPIDGACFAMTLGSDPGTPLLSGRPEDFEILPGTGCPSFLQEWVSSALFHGSASPDLADEKWTAPVLERLIPELRHRIETEVRPALTDAESEAWSIVDASSTYCAAAHSALRAEGPEGLALRDFARRNPFFCGEVLSHGFVRDAIVAGVSDRDAVRLAQEAAASATDGTSVARLPIAHAMLLGKRNLECRGRRLGTALGWYAQLPPEWLPSAGEEADCLYVIDLAERSGFKAPQARIALRNGDWGSLRDRFAPLAQRIGEDPSRTLNAICQRFSAGVVWPLSQLPEYADLGDIESISRGKGHHHRWDRAIVRRLLGVGLDLGSLMALLVRYRDRMPVIAGMEARYAPEYGPRSVMIPGDKVVRHEIEPGLTVALMGVSRMGAAAYVSEFERPVFHYLGRRPSETFAHEWIPPTGQASETPLPTSPRADMFDPDLYASDEGLATLSRPPGGEERVRGVDYDLDVRCQAPILERAVAVRLKVRATDRTRPFHLTAESIVRFLLGDASSPTADLGRLAMAAAGLGTSPSRYVEPGAKGCLFTYIKPEREALEASLEAWRPVLPRGLRKLDLDGLAERLRQPYA